jgi:tRNA U34 5-methylaminomethyl-2-thiouridine-forming methyltransferase MnmC
MDSINISHSTTADGSSTLHSAKFKSHYHSINGAVAESEHIFIGAGLKSMAISEINLLEIGFGTGLNAALTAQFASTNGVRVNYHSLELYPLSAADYQLLNYSSFLPNSTAKQWDTICKSEWNRAVTINNHFSIEKLNVDFTTWTPKTNYHLVYFDAFAPNDQPEMWTQNQFDKISNAMVVGGTLVTYSVKGIVKKALAQAGFSLERLPGPPGKLHILRAKKI